MKKVADNLFRGPRVPVSELEGIVIDIDLETTGQLQEAVNAFDENILVWSSPIVAFLPPSTAKLTTLFRAVEYARMIGPTYVHCKQGVDRTGLVIAAWRVLAQGWKPDRAADECLAEGMHWWFYPWLAQLWRL